MGLLFIVTFSFCLIFSIILSKLIYDSFFSPLGVYGLVWNAFPLLYLLSPLPWPTLSPGAAGGILLNWASFSLASITVVLVSRKQTGERSMLNKYRVKVIIIVFGLLGFAGSLLAIYQVVTTYGLETIINRAYIVRRQIAFAGTGPLESLTGSYLLAFTFASAAFSGLYLGYFRDLFLPCFIPLISIALWSLSKLGRWQLIIAILIYGVSWWLGKRKRGEGMRIRTSLLILVGVGIGVIVLVTSLRGGLPGGNLARYFQGPQSQWSLFMAAIIERLNVPIWRLNNVLTKPAGVTFGMHTFTPVAKLLSRLGLVEYVGPTFVKNINPLKPQFGENYMPVSYLSNVYSDFGLLGLSFVPYLLGGLTSVLFLRKSMVSVVILTFLYVSLIWSFDTWLFSSTFFFLSFLLTIVVAPILQKTHKGQIRP